MEGAADHSKFEQQLNIERNCGMDVEQTLEDLQPYLKQRNEACCVYKAERNEDKSKILIDIIVF